MIRTVPLRSSPRSILVFLFFLANTLALNLLPFNAIGAEPPKQILSAKISLKVKWDKRGGPGNRRRGKMQIRIQGLLKLNKQFSSLEQGLPAVMVPYKVTTMNGNYNFEETREEANRSHCANPAARYKGSGVFTIKPYPGPGNLMLHYMGNMSKELAPLKKMAPAGAFDALIDRYLFAVTIPQEEVKGISLPNAKPCVQKDTSQRILGDRIEIHFKFNENGTMSGHRSWSSDSGLSANVSVSNLPAVFNAKPFSPAKSSPGDVSYDLEWEIKEPSLARILMEIKLPTGNKTWKDITDDETEITVGKRLRFKGAVLPEGKVKKPIGDWTLEGDGGGKHKPFFKKFDANIHHGRVIELDPEKDLKKKNMITLFWSGGKQGHVRFSTNATGEALTAEARLKILKPDYKVDVIAQQESTIGPAFTGGALNKDCMGSGAQGAVQKRKWWLQHDGIEFKAENMDKGKIDGQEQWVQILRKHDLWQKFDDNYPEPKKPYHQYLTDALDACYPYQRGSMAGDNPAIPLADKEGETITEKHTWVDEKGKVVKITDGKLMFTEGKHDCRMVLMFKPEGKKGETEWVPIKEIFWIWNASAEYSDVYKWQLIKSLVLPGSPKAKDTDTFPEWEKNAADPNSYKAD